MHPSVYCLLCVYLVSAISIDDSYVYEEQVKIYDIRRFRRDMVQFPVEKEVRFTFKHQRHYLRLKRNWDIDIKRPVYVLRNGKVEQQTVPNRKTTIFYQDITKKAAIALTCRRKKMGRCQHSLKGTLIINGTYHAIEPLEVPHHRNILHRIYQPPETVDFKSDFIYTEGGKRPRMYNHTENQRSKRYVGELKVELFVVTDFPIYNFWYQRSTKTTVAEKDFDAKGKIREFYAFTINAIDLRYQSITGVTFTIKVVYAGILIADDPSSSTWTESVKISAPSRDQVDSSNALNNFRTWISSASGLPGYDHAMLFTGYDLTSGGSSSNAGLAWLSATCTASSNSIVEDHFDAIIATVAAHELGHNLGAAHDGDGNSCLADDKYTMSPSSGGVTDSRAINHWSFSSCSVSYFEQYIADLDTGGNNCMSSLTASHNPTAIDSYLTTLAGQVYSIDEQCRIKKDNSSSFFCRNFISDPSAVCAFMYCSIPDGSGYCSTAVPWEGTSCGNQKWCIAGQCVSDSRAASVPDTCVFGDTPGVIANDMDCATLISTFPGYCYQSYYQGKCCGSCAATYISYIPGCEYGDHNTGCVASSCSFYSAATLSSGCCGTCYTGTTPGPTTTTTGITTTAGLTTTQSLTTTDGLTTAQQQSSTSPSSISLISSTTAPTTPSFSTYPTSSTTSTIMTTASCSGDNPQITISGNNCSVAIAVSQHNCYSSSINTYCCESCASVYTGVSGCEYGDRSTSCDVASCPYYDSHSRDVLCCDTCGSITTASPGSCPNGDNPYYTVNGMNCSAAALSQNWVCYDTSIHENCCESCPTVNTGITGCEFGDRSTACDEASCPFYDPTSRDVTCCLTCNPQTTTLPPTTTSPSTTTTTLPQTTTTPTTTTTTLPITTTTPTTTTTTTLTPTTTKTTTLTPTTTTTTTLTPTTTTTTTLTPTTTTTITLPITTTTPTTTATTLTPTTTTTTTTTTLPPSTTTPITTTITLPPTTTTPTTTTPTLPPSTTTPTTTTTTLLPTTTTTTTLPPSTTTSSTMTTTFPPTTPTTTTTTLPPSTTTPTTTTTTLLPTTTTTTTLPPSTTTSSTMTTTLPPTTPTTTTTTLPPSTNTPTTTTTTLPPITTTTTTLPPSTTTSSTMTTTLPPTTPTTTTTTLPPSTNTPTTTTTTLPPTTAPTTTTKTLLPTTTTITNLPPSTTTPTTTLPSTSTSTTTTPSQATTTTSTTTLKDPNEGLGNNHSSKIVLSHKAFLFCFLFLLCICGK
ncbi:uncharacterized protein LOC134238008 [Saccostrea cucullata]|uniref:uncharacterized protein LOC134238008 n=1 Tax=Saccostrea cuccullata TaxID=36930 RepID=UPI002ED0E60E